MPARPDHLTEREYRLLVFVEERARACDLMRQQVKYQYGEAAELNLGLHEGGARELRKLARRIRRASIPGWTDS